MEKKNLLFVAAAMVMAGCASDDMIGDNNATQSDNQVIGFNMNTTATTRAAGTKTDATKLNNMFIVWGEKNETNGVKASEANTVFQNYVVKYTDDTANTTTSNTNNWEYVGIDHADFDANVKNTIGTEKAQTIKYWDDNASSYTFTAVSALQDDIKNGKVIITKNVGTDSEDASKTVYDKGYTIQVKTGASTDNIFYADRKNIAKSSGYSHEPVQLTFRSFQSKVRFGIYETVPGYKVLITDVKYNNSTSHTPADATANPTKNADKFGVDGDFMIAGDNTAYTVAYEDNNSSNENKVKVTATGKNTQNYFEGGTNILAQTSNIGTTASSPTWDITDGGYTPILPNPGNTTNMKLKISYKLISEDTGEIINVTDKTAEVPAAYCQWKSNYAYSYIFKISDKSTDLYPITFDAVVVTDEIGNQETITEVSEPSITTYAVTSSGAVETEKNEYQAADVIYASVVEGSNIVDLVLSSNIKLYTVALASGVTNYDITEASVANAIAQNSDLKLTVNDVTTSSGASITTDQDKVPAEDGTKRNISALKWTAGASGTYYAVEYVKDSTHKYYKIVKIQ